MLVEKQAKDLIEGTKICQKKQKNIGQNGSTRRRSIFMKQYIMKFQVITGAKLI